MCKYEQRATIISVHMLPIDDSNVTCVSCNVG
jgi:hypothetical protein